MQQARRTVYFYSAYVCFCVVRSARINLLHARQVPAGLHILTQRQTTPRARVHIDTARLHGNHVGYQDYQNNSHRIPGHGQLWLFLYDKRFYLNM